jgi:hypothetical protein
MAVAISDLRGAQPDRGEAAGTVPVHRDARNAQHAVGHRSVPSEITTAVKALGENHVVETLWRQARSANRLGEDEFGELLACGVSQRALTGSSDCRASCTDDDWVGHVHLSGTAVDAFTAPASKQYRCHNSTILSAV